MGKNPTQKIAAKAAASKDKAVETSPVKAKAKKKAPAKVQVKTKANDRHCKIASCKREYRAKGYCGAHYTMWRQGKYGVARYKTCKDFECKKPMALNRHGYCEDHFQNYYVKGMATPTVEAKPADTKPVAKDEKVA